MSKVHSYAGFYGCEMGDEILMILPITVYRQPVEARNTMHTVSDCGAVSNIALVFRCRPL
jgi:hypothetical protein